MAIINGDNNPNRLYGVLDAGVDQGDTIRGYGGSDTLYAYNPTVINWRITDVLEGGDGDDWLWGKNGGNDILYGGAGNDSLVGFQNYENIDGTNHMYGGPGNDNYHFYVIPGISASSFIELPNEGIDTVYLRGEGGYQLRPNFENLYLQSLGGTQDGVGNDLNNQIHGNNEFNQISGKAGDDLLKGYGGTDIIGGDDGNDQIYGGFGQDSLFGGTGSDKFFFESVSDSAAGAYKDSIRDFSSAQGDKIDVSAIDANLTLAGNQAFTQGSYINGILTGDVIGGADIQIEITGAPALVMGVDVIL